MNQRSDTDPSESSPHRNAHLSIGGGLVLISALAVLVLNIAHGDLPGTGQAAMEHINPTFWRPIHILTIVSIMVGAGGLVLIVRTFTAPVAAAIGRVGSVFVIVAAAVFGVDFAIDGFVLSALVENWEAATDPAARETAVAQADFVLTIMGGTSFAFQTLYGTAVGTLAGATLASREYSRWLCWVGIVGGAVWGTIGLLLFAQIPGVQFWMIFPASLLAIAWQIGIGWISWRRGRAGPMSRDATRDQKERSEDNV